MNFCKVVASHGKGESFSYLEVKKFKIVYMYPCELPPIFWPICILFYLDVLSINHNVELFTEMVMHSFDQHLKLIITHLLMNLNNVM